jgi:hypothetical protein
MFASQVTGPTPVATGHLSKFGVAKGPPSHLARHNLGSLNELWSPKHRHLTQGVGTVMSVDDLWAQQRRQLNQAVGLQSTDAGAEARFGWWHKERDEMAHEGGGQHRRTLHQLPITMGAKDQQVVDKIAELERTIGGQGQECEENLRGVVAPPPGKTSDVAALYVAETPHGDDVTFCNLLSLPSIMQVCRRPACS